MIEKRTPYDTEKKLLWPHENLDELLNVEGDILNSEERCGYIGIAGKFYVIKALSYLGIPRESEIQEEVMAFINGNDTSFLGNKYNFIESVQKMGYIIPRQTLVTLTQPFEDRLDRIREAFLDEKLKFFVNQSMEAMGEEFI